MCPHLIHILQSPNTFSPIPAIRSLSFGRARPKHNHLQTYSALRSFDVSEGINISPQVELRTRAEFEPSLLLASISGCMLSEVLDPTVHNTPHHNTSSLLSMSHLQSLTLRKLGVSEATKILLTKVMYSHSDTSGDKHAIPLLRNILLVEVYISGETEEISSMAGEFIDVLGRRRQCGVGLSRM